LLSGYTIDTWDSRSRLMHFPKYACLLYLMNQLGDLTIHRVTQSSECDDWKSFLFSFFFASQICFYT
jgi:hypothetical protein